MERLGESGRSALGGRGIYGPGQSQAWRRIWGPADSSGWRSGPTRALRGEGDRAHIRDHQLQQTAPRQKGYRSRGGSGAFPSLSQGEDPRMTCQSRIVPGVLSIT